FFHRRQPYPAEATPFRFLLCSRLLKSKGIALFARSIAQLQQKGYAVEGWLLGLPETSHPDKLPAADLDNWCAQGWMVYKGATGDVRPWLEQAHAYAFTSHYNEGVPRSLMEAASMELPVLVPDLRGCRDLVTDGETGFLFRPHDPAHLLEKMEAMLHLPAEQRRAMGAAGRALVQAQFETDKVIAIYRETIAKSL
ncbi:MAG: glycosyltransferase, partial [Flavihumibacter sp.]